MASYAATAGNRVIQQEHHDRADDGHEHAPYIESRYPSGAYKGEQEPPGNRADDPEDNVQDDASPCLFTILLAIKPAIRPKMIQPIMDI